VPKDVNEILDRREAKRSARLTAVVASLPPGELTHESVAELAGVPLGYLRWRYPNLTAVSRPRTTSPLTLPGGGPGAAAEAARRGPRTGVLDVLPHLLDQGIPIREAPLRPKPRVEPYLDALTVQDTTEVQEIRLD
jgi:hypothetical protein